MFTKLLVFCSAIAILSIATESLADTIEVIEIDPRTFQQTHQNQQCQQYAKYYDNYYNNYYRNYYNKYYNNYYYNYYKQQNNLQSKIPNINIGNAKVEWVCTNPKTKDTVILGSETVPVNNNGHYYPPQQPNYPQQPQYPQQQPNYPPQQPNYPPVQPTFPTNSNPPQNPNNQPQQPSQPEKPINTNGEGLIDIRFGDE